MASGIPSYLASLLEVGAVTRKNETADPRMIRYITSIYPSNAGVELVILDVEDFRLLARLAEPRLAVYLEEMAINLDCALASKASEGGLMINNLQNERNPATVPRVARANTQEDINVDDMNYTKSKDDYQNKKY